MGKVWVRRPLDSVMDGMAVFAFGLKRAPESVLRLLEYSQVEKDNIDLFIFHQANFFMNEKIRKKLEYSCGESTILLRNFGNTVVLQFL